MLGLSDKPNLLIVCHCYREANNRIRIISARKATKEMAQKSGLSYQNLINLYLKDCVNSNRELKMQWG
jgi:uncharacterized DUF497 family protein